MKNRIIQNALNRHTIAMVIAYVLPLASFAGLSYLGIIESWGFYVLFLLCPLAGILIVESLHPTPQKAITHKNLRKGRAVK